MIIINDAGKLSRTALCALALLCCAASSAGEIHEYTIIIDAQISRMSVEAKFASAVHNISARASNAGKFLISARECQSGAIIRNRNRRLQVPDSGIRCMTYVVDLSKAARSEQRNRTLAETNILVSPAAWLWRPALSTNNEIHVSFRLPENVHVAVPWASLPGSDNAYRLTTSPENAAAPAAFGKIAHSTARVSGAELAVTLLQAKTPLPAQPIFDWVASTADNISLAYGRFPSPAAHVFVIPAGNRWGSDKAVLFGRVMRDGGETVELLVNEHRPIDEYYGSWTATHEFSHLMLPYVYSRHRWISEGFAQYYQNVLLSRAGTYTELVAWQNLYNGFERGRNSSPSLSPNGAARDRSRDSTMKVYWSGAALALMADVELRRRSNGIESLDTVLDRLQECCLPSARTWDGPELFEKLDALVDEPVFMPLYHRYADSSGFPDVHPLLERLGLVIDSDEVSFHGGSELADIRSSITAHRRQDSKQASVIVVN